MSQTIPPAKKFKIDPLYAKASHMTAASEKQNFLWIIWDFKKFPIGSQTLKSCEFQLSKKNTEKLRFQTQIVLQEGIVQPSLTLLNNTKNDFISTHITFSIIGNKFVNRYSKSHNYCFNNNHKTCYFVNFIALKDILSVEKNMIDDDLVLLCELSILSYKSTMLTLESNSADIFFSLDLKNLFEQNHFSDFLIVVKDKKFQCHKAVLACRSEYFASMLKHETKEKHESQLILNDIEPDIFEKVLRYIYTGNISITPTCVLQIIVAADKYRMDRLHTLCEVKLSSFLCQENAINIYKYSVMYNLKRIRMQAERLMQAFRKKDGGWHYYHIVPDALSLTKKKKKRRKLIEREDSISFDNSSEKEKQNEIEIIDISSPTVEKNNNTKFPDVYCGGSFSKWSDENDISGISTATTTIPPVADVWCCTKTHHLITMKWRVEDIREYCGSENLCIKSLEFYAEDEANDLKSSWQLEMKSLNQQVANSSLSIKYLPVSLVCTSWNRDPGIIDFRVFIMSKHSTEYYVATGSMKFKINVSANVATFVAKDIIKKKGLIHEGSIYLCCILITRKSSLFDSIEPPVEPYCDLRYCISAMFANRGQGSDVCFLIKTQQFFCHKGLLACRSLYLKEMLEKQPETNFFDLGKDIDPILFQFIVEHIYGRSYDAGVDMAKKLVPLADKFCLFQMKKTLENILISSLSAENAVTLLIFSEQYNASLLKLRSLDCISMNLQKVMELPSWGNIMKNEKLLNECLMASTDHQMF